MRFLITWTTYGCWLPGDPRGFRTRDGKEFIPPPARYSDGEPYEPDSYKRLYERCLSESRKPVTLDESQKQVVADCVAEICSGFAREAAIAVTENHVHISIDLPADVTTGYFCSRAKSVSSLRLSSYRLKGKVWARRYHARRISAADADRVRRYVCSHKAEDAVIIEFHK